MPIYEVTGKVQIKADNDTDALLGGCQLLRNKETYLRLGVKLQVIELKS